jgi:cysteine desulfurase/selenocysteine lyase
VPVPVADLRRDFPALARTVNGHPLIYLDSAATSQKPQSVLDAERDLYEHHNGAVHRGAHTLATEATTLFEAARERVAAFIGADAQEVVFTRNATESINLVAYAFSNSTAGRGGTAAQRFRLAEGDEILVTELEHHANLVPWQELAARTGATLRHLWIEDDGSVRLEEAAGLIGPRTKLIAFAHASNVLGSITPVAELVRLARNEGALVLLDACQSAPHLAIDLKALDVDFAVFSGHKMLGPLGVGVLYGRQELLDAMPPFLTGGSMITTVTMEEAEYLPAPARFEAGTQPIAQAVGLAAAVDYLDGIGMDEVHERDARLGQLLASGLSDVPGIRLLGPAPGSPRIGLAGFVVDGVHPHDVAQYLDGFGIAVRAGHHCAQPLHRRLGIPASTRASTSVYTTDDEILALLDALGGIRAFFRA